MLGVCKYVLKIFSVDSYFGEGIDGGAKEKLLGC